MDTNIQLTPHFNLQEFLHDASPDGLTPDISANLQQLAIALEKVRAMCGNRPIFINSGFRTPEHNEEVGGAPNSQHLLGKAADIEVQGLKPCVVQEILHDWNGGLGSYETWTHVDTGEKRRWTGA